MTIIRTDGELLTLDGVRKSFPCSHRSLINQELVDKLNNISQDMDEAENIRDNFLSFARIIKEGRFTVEAYLSAVKFISLKMMGHTDRESYIRTFPVRYANMVAKNFDDKRMSSLISAYANTKLVNLIYEQTYIPTWILNRDIHQEAINVTADLMRSAKSEKVRCDAANNLLNHLKRPESTQIDLNMNVRDSSGILELRQALADMAHAQIQQIQSGVPTKSIAQQRLNISSSGSDYNQDDIIDINNSEEYSYA